MAYTESDVTRRPLVRELPVATAAVIDGISKAQLYQRD